MSLHVLANQMAAKGRKGDSMLVHMTPGEVYGLQALAVKHGGTLTINPDTGLPEANFLKKLLPTIIGAGLSFIPGVGPLMAAGIVGGFETLRTGDIGKGFMAGLGAYSGAGLVAGVAGAGTASLGRDAIASATDNVVKEGLTGTARDAAMQQSVASQLAAKTPFDRISAGFGEVTKDASSMLDFAKQNKNILGSLALPMLAGQAVKDRGPQTVTQPGMIRPYEYNPYGGTFTAGTPYKAANGGLMQLDKNSPRMANGGSVAFAEGGYTSYTPEQIAAHFKANPNADIAADIAKYNADPAAVYARIAGTTSGYRDPTLTESGTGTLGTIQGLTGAGVDAGELYTSLRANDPQYGDTGYWNKGTITNAFDVGQKVLAFDPINDAGSPSDAQWVGFMDSNKMSTKDISLATGLTEGEVQRRYDAAKTGLSATQNKPTPPPNAVQNTTAPVKTLTNIATADRTTLPAGVGGGGITVLNPNGTITTRPNIPGIPEGGFTGMEDVRDAYTAGGGSLGYTPYVPTSMGDFDNRYNTLSGGSKSAFDYLRGGSYVPRPTSAPKPYRAANGGLMQLDKNSPRMANGGSVSFAAGGQTVEDLYQSVLGRGSDAGGLAYWQQQFGNEISPEEAAQFRAGAVPELAIKNAYQEQFGRPVEQAGYDYWTQQGAGNANYDYGASIRTGAQGQDIRARDDTTREGMTFGNAILTDPNLRYDADNNTWGTTPVKKPTDIATADKTVLPAGVGGGGITTINPNGTITTRPNIPGIPEGGFTGMRDVRDAYTAGGGSLGYTPYVPTSMADFNNRYNTLSGGSKAAYDFLRGGAYDPKPSTPTGEIMKPYWESVAGFPVDESTKQFIFKDGKYERNVNYVPPLYLRNNPSKPPTSPTPPGTSWVLDSNKIWQVAAQKPTTDPGLGKEWTLNDMQKWVATDIKASTTGTTTNPAYNFGQGAGGGDNGFGINSSNSGSNSITGGFLGSVIGSQDPAPVTDMSSMSPDAAADAAAAAATGPGGDGSGGGGQGNSGQGGDGNEGLANGGLLQAYKRMAAGGMSSLGSYSDGGRLLRGPGDGVSDNIPAVIGNRQPARLADGEFVVPARIVSEIGNGSTEAGARELYKMMDRIQKNRSKTVGKNRVAVDSKSRNLLPA